MVVSGASSPAGSWLLPPGPPSGPGPSWPCASASPLCQMLPSIQSRGGHAGEPVGASTMCVHTSVCARVCICACKHVHMDILWPALYLFHPPLNKGRHPDSFSGLPRHPGPFILPPDSWGRPPCPLAPEGRGPIQRGAGHSKCVSQPLSMPLQHSLFLTCWLLQPRLHGPHVRYTRHLTRWASGRIDVHSPSM